ncbi:MAG: methyltransferase domain-containing protein [Methanomicrobiales archaeon]|nr:methyltransferase domain-containing protein [Methanomicrobiales archaeon]
MNNPVLLLFELSGEHPTLPTAEVEAVGRIIKSYPQVAIAECHSLDQTKRLSLCHVVMEYLGQCRATETDILTFITRLYLVSSDSFRVRVKKVQGASPMISASYLEVLIGDHIQGEVSLDNPENEFRMVLSGEWAFFGRVIHVIDRGAYLYRNPLRRPFFHPGVMLPRFARTMVNLSLICSGELLIDPFCGTGGMLLEGKFVGAELAGGDVDPCMVAGTRKNIPHVDVVIEDAAYMPFQDDCADAVVTDLPYGQSVGIRAENLSCLSERALAEIFRVLKRGRRAVVISHRDIRHLAGDFVLLQYHKQRVHKSLTRHTMVLKKE